MERLIDRANRERRQRTEYNMDVIGNAMLVLFVIWIMASFINVNTCRPDIAVWNFFRIFM